MLGLQPLRPTDVLIGFALAYVMPTAAGMAYEAWLSKHAHHSRQKQGAAAAGAASASAVATGAGRYVAGPSGKPHVEEGSGSAHGLKGAPPGDASKASAIVSSGATAAGNGDGPSSAPDGGPATAAGVTSTPLCQVAAVGQSGAAFRTNSSAYEFLKKMYAKPQSCVQRLHVAIKVGSVHTCMHYCYIS